MQFFKHNKGTELKQNTEFLPYQTPAVCTKLNNSLLP